MSKENNDIVYTAHDIQRYLDGQMSNAEMHAMEKAALDDPLLAEAIEGYDAMDEHDWTTELAQLKQQLATVENSPVVPVYKNRFATYWKAAAAVLIIASTVATAYIFTKDKAQPAQTIASNGNQPIPPIPVAPPKDSLAIRTDSTVATLPSMTNITFSSTTLQQANDKLKVEFTTLDSTRNSDFVYTPSPKQPEPAFNDVAVNYRRDAEKDQREEVSVNNQVPAAWSENSDARLRNGNNYNMESAPSVDKYWYANEQNKASSANNGFAAQVVTPDNKPIAQANVVISQYKKPVYTDANGIFKVGSTDSTVNVVVTAAGYNSQKIRLSNSQNRIVMQPADVAQQINIGAKRTAVAGKKKAEVVEGLDEDGEADAAPSGGWVQYNNYIDNNRVLPASARQQNIHGEVEVFVQLKSNGEIAKVKVEKPLCPECDAEAVRLVTEGPKWDVKANKGGKAKVKIKF